MKRCWLVILLVVLRVPSLAQTDQASAFPPELSGPAKEFKKPSQADMELFQILGHLNDSAEVRSMLPRLDEFIKNHPDYWDAYFLRATCNACMLDSRDFASISQDVQAAMSHGDQPIYNRTDHYSLLGKIALVTGHYSEALQDLEKAMMRDPDSASKMFNIEGIKPEQTSKLCVWNLSDLDALIAHFPKDYRPRLYRGLYYEFFTTFNEDYYPSAMRNYEEAALLNPRSPLPQYFIGYLHSQASLWTTRAAASDEVRDEEVKNAVEAYTRAIQLDRNFLPAIEHRASGFSYLKRYSDAISDYNRILALDPGNSIAYSDRGLVELETGRYAAAILDFGEAIRRKDDDDSYLPNLYENRADAQVKIGQYADAIADYSSAIKLQLGGSIILLSLSQIRSLYPEASQVSDDVLSHRLHDLFYPQMAYADFATSLAKNGKWEISFLLNDVYQKRGDTYLASGDFRRGVSDFMRIYNASPKFARYIDRWRRLGTTSDGEEYFLDVQTAEFPTNGPVRLWLKMIGKTQSQKVEHELDCRGRRMQQSSLVTYDSEGNLLSTSDVSSGWQKIVPDSIGEQVFNGACRSEPERFSAAQ